MSFFIFIKVKAEKRGVIRGSGRKKFKKRLKYFSQKTFLPVRAFFSF